MGPTPAAHPGRHPGALPLPLCCTAAAPMQGKEGRSGALEAEGLGRPGAAALTLAALCRADGAGTGRCTAGPLAAAAERPRTLSMPLTASRFLAALCTWAPWRAPVLLRLPAKHMSGSRGSLWTVRQCGSWLVSRHSAQRLVQQLGGRGPWGQGGQGCGRRPVWRVAWRGRGGTWWHVTARGTSGRE